MDKESYEQCMLPCPFCGERAILDEVIGDSHSYAVIRCSGCQIKTPRYYDPVAAILNWNRRVKSDTEVRTDWCACK